MVTPLDNRSNLLHETNRVNEQSERTTTIFPHATPRLVRKHFESIPGYDFTSTEPTIYDFKERTDPTLMSISKEVSSLIPPAATKLKREPLQKICSGGNG